MRIRILLVATLCSISATLVPAASEAADIQVSIEGTEISCPSASCASEFVLSNNDGTPKAYSGFTIEGRMDGPTRKVAKVVMQDGAADSLQLLDAWIVSTQASLTRAIAFWRVFSAPPNAPPTAQFTREVHGFLVRGTAAALDDWVVVTGQVNGDEIDVEQAKYVLCSLDLCGKFDFTKYEDWFTLGGARSHLGWFKFFLRDSGDKLSLTTFTVQGGPAGEVKEENLRGTMEGIPKEPGYRSLEECRKRDRGHRCSALPRPDRVPGKGEMK